MSVEVKKLAVDGLDDVDKKRQRKSIEHFDPTKARKDDQITNKKRKTEEITRTSSPTISKPATGPAYHGAMPVQSSADSLTHPRKPKIKPEPTQGADGDVTKATVKQTRKRKLRLDSALKAKAKKKAKIGTRSGVVDHATVGKLDDNEGKRPRKTIQLFDPAKALKEDQMTCKKRRTEEMAAVSEKTNKKGNAPTRVEKAAKSALLYDKPALVHFMNEVSSKIIATLSNDGTFMKHLSNAVNSLK